MNEMTRATHKYILILLIFSLLSCGKTQKKKRDDVIDKDSISKQRIERISYGKNKIDSLNKRLNWKKLKSDLWINTNGKLGIKTVEVNQEGIDIDRYITELCCEEKSLNSVIDTTSFEFIGSSFYKDKNHIYTHYIMSDGGIFWILKEADVSTFEVIGDCYAKDKNHVFGERAMLMDSVDYKTFKTKKGIGCFAKDKNGFYFWDDKIDIDGLNDSLVKRKIIELKQL